MADKKGKLIQFLKKEAFDPVLRARESDYPPTNRKVLQLVKRKTQSEVERYQGYESAGQVRQEFEDDLHSQAAQKTNQNLKKLGLPQLADIKDDFLAYADQLGVTQGKRERRHHRPHPPHPWHKSDPKEKKRAWEELMKLYRQGKLSGEERRAAEKHAREQARVKSASRTAGESARVAHSAGRRQKPKSSNAGSRRRKAA